MDLGLDGHAYLLTGAGRGLGYATASALVGDGARVLISGRTEKRLRAATAELGPNAAFAVADNADPAAADALVEECIARFGRIDGALISVGGPPTGTVLETSDDAWQASFESVFLGAIRIARTVAAKLPDGGSIAFVLSSSVKSPLPNMAISNGLRAGLAMTAKTLADELGPRGIRVNALLPGRVETDRVIELDESTGDRDAAKAQALTTIPLGRYGRPEEFGAVAAFVLSPAAGFVTGVMLPVDGGMLRSL